MTKLLGLTLMVSGIIALAAGAIISSQYDGGSQITGNLISNIIGQPKISMGLFDYAVALLISYSIISLIMGGIFMARR